MWEGGCSRNYLHPFHFPLKLDKSYFAVCLPLFVQGGVLLPLIVFAMGGWQSFKPFTVKGHT